MKERDRHRKSTTALCTQITTKQRQNLTSESSGLYRIQFIEITYTGIVRDNFHSNLPTELSVNTVKVCPPTLCRRNGCSLGALTEAGFPPISLMLASSSFKVNDT